MGSIMAVIFGPKSGSEEPTISDLESNAVSGSFLAFFLVLTGLTLLDFVGVKLYEKKNKHEQEVVHGAKFLMVSYVSLAAYFGSVNVLFMKAMVIILATFDVVYLEQWLLYFVILGIVLVNVLLEFFRQRALAYFGALFVVPIYQVLLIVGSAMMGAVFFDEFAGLESWELALFVVAIAVTMGGVGMMAFNVGKGLVKVERALKVAFQRADKRADIVLAQVGDTMESIQKPRRINISPAFPVWGGILSRIFQNYYLQSVSFVGEAMEAVGDSIRLGVNETVGVGKEITHSIKDKGKDIKEGIVKITNNISNRRSVDNHNLQKEEQQEAGNDHDLDLDNDNELKSETDSVGLEADGDDDD